MKASRRMKKMSVGILNVIETRAGVRPRLDLSVKWIYFILSSFMSNIPLTIDSYQFLAANITLLQIKLE